MQIQQRIHGVMFRRVSFLFLVLSASACGVVAQDAKAPAASEPAAGDTAQTGKAQLAEAQQRLKKLSATEYDLDGIRINAATHEVRIPTKINLKKAPIEYMLVHETGKTHESVLTTAVSPSSIQVALLLANYAPSSEGLMDKVPEAERSPAWKVEPPAAPKGNRIRAEVEWQSGAETKRLPLSQWVQHVDTRKPPADLDTWVFNGSYIDERGFIGQHEGSIIAVWLDRGAIMNSPAEGNWRDELWISLPANIPDEGTPVTLILTPETAPDKGKSSS